MLRHFFFGAWPLFIGLFFIMAGNSIQGSLIAYRTGVENYSHLVSGLIISGYFIGMLVSVFITPHYLQTVGHLRLFAALTAMLSAALLIFPLIVHPLIWFMLRLLVGFCYVGLFIVTEAWINALATNEVRGRVTAFYMIVQFLAFIAGQMLLRLTTPESATLFLVASIGVSVAAVPMLTVRVNMPPQPESNRIMPFGELYRLSPFAGVGTFFVAMISGIFYAALGFFGQKVGLDLKQLSVMTMLVFIAAMLSQWPMAQLSDRIDRRLVIMLLTLSTVTFGIIGIGLNLDNVLSVYVIIFIISLAVMPIYSINLAHVNDVVPLKKVVAVSSTLQLVGAMGASMGPILMTGFMSAFDAAGFFIFLVCSNGALFAYAFYRWRSRAVTIHSHTAITPMTQIQSAITEPLQMGDEEVQWDISKHEKPAYRRSTLMLDILQNIFKGKDKAEKKAKKNK